jgi:hypothetical protein
MIDRRQLLTGGGLLGVLAPAGEGAEYGAGQMSERTATDVVTTLQKISSAISTVAAQASFDAIVPLRTRQLDYLRANGKFPDFIEVGVDAWMAAHDWHVRFQQPLTVNRDAVGRYTLMLGFTALVLRPDVAPPYIGAPYDNR